MKQLLIDLYYLPSINRIYQPKPEYQQIHFPVTTVSQMIIPYCIPLIYYKEIISQRQTDIHSSTVTIVKEIEKINKQIPSKKSHIQKFQKTVPQRVSQIAKSVTELNEKMQHIRQKVDTVQKFIDGMNEFVDYKFGKKMNDHMKKIFVEEFEPLVDDSLDIHPCFL